MMKCLIVILALAVFASANLIDVIPHYSHNGYGNGISTRYFKRNEALGFGLGYGYGGYGLGYGGNRLGYGLGYGGYGLGYVL